MSEEMSIGENINSEGFDNNSDSFSEQILSEISNQASSREKVNIQEILEFVKQHNSTSSNKSTSNSKVRPAEVDMSEVADTPSAVNKAKKRKKKKGKDTENTEPQPTHVPGWEVSEELVKEVENKLINAQHQKIPIVLVFDLNGTLVKRGGQNKKQIYLRPYVKEFIEFCMQNFYVITWTTAKPLSSYTLINSVFGPYTKFLLCNLTRLHCNLNGSYYKNPSTIKNLEVIWNEEFNINPKEVIRTQPSPPIQDQFEDIYKDEINLIPDSDARDLYFGISNTREQSENSSGLKFDKTNTILLDDTLSKGETQPENHLLVPEYKGFQHNLTDDGLLKIWKYLDELANQYRLEFDRCEREGAEFNFSVQNYMKERKFSSEEADTMNVKCADNDIN